MRVWKKGLRDMGDERGERDGGRAGGCDDG